MKTNAFRFLLRMPEELNTAIETVAFSQRQSKSEFMREGLRRYLLDVEFNRLNKKRQDTHGTRSGKSAEVHQCPWGVFIAWCCVSLGATSTFLYCIGYFIIRS